MNELEALCKMLVRAGIKFEHRIDTDRESLHRIILDEQIFVFNDFGSLLFLEKRERYSVPLKDFGPIIEVK